MRTLFPYVIGMGAGIVGLSFAISQLFASYPLQTAMLFIGLIFGGLPLLLPKVAGKRPSMAELVVFALFFGLIVWMQFWGEGHSKLLAVDAGTMLSLFLIGALAAAAMVIPGVSGSMLLMSLGYYTPLIDHINAFVTAVVTFEFSTVWYCMGILAPFGIGVLIGAFVIAKLVEYLLKRYERMTYFAILGLVASSLHRRFCRHRCRRGERRCMVCRNHSVCRRSSDCRTARKVAECTEVKLSENK